MRKHLIFKISVACQWEMAEDNNRVFGFFSSFTKLLNLFSQSTKHVSTFSSCSLIRPFLNLYQPFHIFEHILSKTGGTGGRAPRLYFIYFAKILGQSSIPGIDFLAWSRCLLTISILAVNTNLSFLWKIMGLNYFAKLQIFSEPWIN